ncbi:MAG: PCMD domain-containing protein [Rikenellaceae bacterium]
MRQIILMLVAIVWLPSICCAQSIEIEELVPFGDMNQWLTRKVEESAIIGGEEKTLYEIAPQGVLSGRIAYKNRGSSPWANSNVMAQVAGVTKTNCSVFPAKREGAGSAAHLVTRIEEVKVLGIVDISVIAAGSIYLGSMIEPIRGTANPQSMLNSGIEFSKRPKAVRFDYKVQLSGEPNRLRITGFSPRREVAGVDMPTMVLLLQKRWEDEKGQIHAQRIGTMIVEYKADSGWIDDATYEIIYGDATKSTKFIPSMKIGHQQRYALNSKGKNVPIFEDGWGNADEIPTHLILQFASSHGGAYIGSPGNQMLVDDVRLVY